MPYRQLFGSRTVVGVQVVGFSAYWLLTVAVIWLPAFLNQAFGYTPIQAGWIVMLVALCQVALLPVFSVLSDILQRRGASSRIACGWVSSTCALAAGLLTIMLSQSGGLLPTVLCTVIAFSFSNVIFVLGPCLIAEVTPVAQRGATLGVNNAIATLAGPLAPAVMGLVVDIGANPADGFRTGLVIAGTLVILGALTGFFLIDPEADQARNSLDSRAETGSA